MRPSLVLALSFPCISLLPAQDAAADPFGHSRHGDTFDEGPRQAAYLMEGMSAQVHMPIAGLEREAQAFFDQGLCQLHGFWYFESERSFRQVAMLQPECAMAYWGMAMANVENPKRAAGFIANAVERSADVPACEQRWIDALATYYRVDDERRAELRSGNAERVKQARQALIDANREHDDQKLDKALLKDLEALVHEFPDDIEAKALLAVRVWLNYRWGAGIPITSYAGVDALLELVFQRAPLHPAHHYRVHLWDREKAERAVDSAWTLGRTAPGIAHQWHMGGHIFAKLHRHDDAAWQQEASSRVDHAHMARDRVMPFLIHNYGHNQEWLCRSLQHTGRVREARELAANMIALPRHPAWNRVHESGDIADYGRRRLLQVCATYEQWPQLRAVCENGMVEVTGKAVPDAQRLLHLGTACYRTGDLAGGDAALNGFDELIAMARRERAAAVDAAEDEAWKASKERKRWHAAVDEAAGEATDLVDDVRRMQHQLRGERALAQGDGAAAVELLADLPRVPATLRAEAHLANGDRDKAIEVLTEESKDSEGEVPPLVHLLLAQHGAGRTDDARATFERLRTLGRRADLDAPLLRRLQPLAQEFGLPADWRLPGTPPDAERRDQRPPLDRLGPFRWSPTAAPGFDLAASDGARHRLAGSGRPTLVVFYLGFGCLHCIEQLQALAPTAEAFAAAGIDIVAIGTDTPERTAASLDALPEDERFPFPLLADPGLSTFRAWRCHDDFESMPLHGTFLVDADGRVRWQDISYEPFTDIAWLLAECERLLQLPADGVGSR